MEERADTETRRRGDAGNTYSPTHLLTNHPEHLNARMPEGLDSPILLHSSTPPLLFCLSGCRKGAISWMVRIIGIRMRWRRRRSCGIRLRILLY